LIYARDEIAISKLRPLIERENLSRFWMFGGVGGEITISDLQKLINYKCGGRLQGTHLFG